MIPRKRQPLPALDRSSELTTPDLQEIGDKNYTSTIMKYTNLAMTYPQLETDNKTIVGAINEVKETGGGGGTSVIPNPPDTATESLEKIKIETTTYSIDGETYSAGKLIEISEQNAIGVKLVKSTPSDIASQSAAHPDILYYTSGLPTLHKYSTQEQIVGIWVDGRNIYELTIISDTPLSYLNEVEIANLTAYNIDLIIDSNVNLRNTGTSGDVDMWGTQSAYLHYQEGILYIQQQVSAEYDSFTWKTIITIRYVKVS